MEFIWVEGLEEGFNLAREVRHKVFIEEQGFSQDGEFDALDSSSLHIIGIENDVPVCTARMFDDGPGTKHVGRVAVLSSLRGRGIGLIMMEKLAQKAKQDGACKIELASQSDKSGFYEKAGFEYTGVNNVEEGVPHVGMVLRLT